jgi:hypothetical protein
VNCRRPTPSFTRVIVGVVDSVLNPAPVTEIAHRWVKARRVCWQLNGFRDRTRRAKWGRWVATASTTGLIAEGPRAKPSRERTNTSTTTALTAKLI